MQFQASKFLPHPAGRAGRLVVFVRALVARAVRRFAGVAQWLERKPSKLKMRVRFPSPAPNVRPCGSVVEHSLGKGEVASSILAMGTLCLMVGTPLAVGRAATVGAVLFAVSFLLAK